MRFRSRFGTPVFIGVLLGLVIVYFQNRRKPIDIDLP